MPKIERRRAVVELYQGHYEAEIQRLMNEAMAAARMEEIGGTRRMSTKSKANALAAEHDKLVEEAEESSVKVTLWALSYREWDELKVDHPPRPDVPAVLDAEGKEVKPLETFTADQLHGVNTETLPPVLLRAALADPEANHGKTMAERIAAGQAVLDDLGDISQLQYRRLENAAWTVHAGDDSLPKYSLQSLIAQERELGSESPDDKE
jgi:hypothetical protein